MTRRTTALAGTFALMCVAHVTPAQTYARARVGMAVAAPRAATAQSQWAVASVQRAPVRSQVSSSPRIARIAVTPSVQPRAQTWIGRNANQTIAPWQPAVQPNARRDPRPMGRVPPQVLPEPSQPAGLRAAPRGASTARGNKPRIGLVIPGPPATQGQFLPTIFTQTQDIGFIQVAQFSYIPAVVLTDGRVFANFNGSYEQILRQCPMTSGALIPEFTTFSACWMIDPYGRYVVVQPR